MGVNQVQRSRLRDGDNDSMIVETGDNCSIVESASHANLTDYEELLETDGLSEQTESINSSDNDMDTGDNQVSMT